MSPGNMMQLLQVHGERGMSPPGERRTLTSGPCAPDSSAFRAPLNRIYHGVKGAQLQNPSLQIRSQQLYFLSQILAEWDVTRGLWS